MAKQSLLKNTDSIGNIQDSINAFGKSLRAANNTSSVIIRKLNESNYGLPWNYPCWLGSY